MRQPGFYKAKYQGRSSIKNVVVEFCDGAYRVAGLRDAYFESDFIWVDKNPILFEEPKTEFQIRVISCKYPQGWYKNLIGTIVDVRDAGDFWIPIDEAFYLNDSIFKHIHKEDAELLPF